jgi:hypothetical protein
VQPLEQKIKAQDFLRKGAELLEERGKQYDQPGGERSMGKAVGAFNIITGRDLTEAEGWLLLQTLKDVRQWQNPDVYHADSAEDCVSYAALKAEALEQEGKGRALEALKRACLATGGPVAPGKTYIVGEMPSQHMSNEPASLIDDESPRAQAIGQNGNDGLHYDFSWTGWLGGKMPVDRNTMVCVRYRNGKEPGKSQAYNWSWNHGHGDYDVIAYRLAKDAQ